MGLLAEQAELLGLAGPLDAHGSEQHVLAGTAHDQVLADVVVATLRVGEDGNHQAVLLLVAVAHVGELVANQHDAAGALGEVPAAILGDPEDDVDEVGLRLGGDHTSDPWLLLELHSDHLVDVLVALGSKHDLDAELLVEPLDVVDGSRREPLLGSPPAQAEPAEGAVDVDHQDHHALFDVGLEGDGEDVPGDVLGLAQVLGVVGGSPAHATEDQHEPDEAEGDERDEGVPVRRLPSKDGAIHFESPWGVVGEYAVYCVRIGNRLQA